MQYYISFMLTTHWLDIYITYDVIILESLVPIWHHTCLLQYYWLHSLSGSLRPLTVLETGNLYIFDLKGEEMEIKIYFELSVLENKP